MKKARTKKDIEIIKCIQNDGKKIQINKHYNAFDYC